MVEFDVKKWKAEAERVTRKTIQYVFETSDEPLVFTLKPRVLALVERVAALVNEDTYKRAKLMEKIEAGEDIDEVDIPRSEYELRWEIFKTITEGPHEVVEKDLFNLMDVELVNRAISDFFALYIGSMNSVNHS